MDPRLPCSSGNMALYFPVVNIYWEPIISRHFTCIIFVQVHNNPWVTVPQFKRIIQHSKWVRNMLLEICHNQDLNQGALTSSPSSLHYAVMVSHCSDLMLCGLFYCVIAELAHYSSLITWLLLSHTIVPFASKGQARQVLGLFEKVVVNAK